MGLQTSSWFGNCRKPNQHVSKGTQGWLLWRDDMFLKCLYLDSANSSVRVDVGGWSYSRKPRLEAGSTVDFFRSPADHLGCNRINYHDWWVDPGFLVAINVVSVPNYWSRRSPWEELMRSWALCLGLIQTPKIWKKWRSLKFRPLKIWVVTLRHEEVKVVGFCMVDGYWLDIDISFCKFHPHRILGSKFMKWNPSTSIDTPPKFNIEPENGCLEDEIPIGNHPFSGAMLVSGRVVNFAEFWCLIQPQQTMMRTCWMKIHGYLVERYDWTWLKSGQYLGA